MSTNVIEQNLDFNQLSPDLVETSTGRKIKQASAVRWVWQPLKDIPLFDNLGPAVVNSLTLREARNKQNEPTSNPVQYLKRCQPYPLTNCEYEVPRHEAKRYGNFGEEIPENDLPSSYAGADPKGGKVAHVPESKFAYTSARELSDQYAKEFGLVVLEPLTGMEDAEVVKQVFQMVQPKSLRLVNLEKDLNSDAVERIRKSTHPKAVKDLAEGCRKLMLKGVAAAKATASAHMGDFSRQVQLAGAGQKGHRAFPAEFDREMAAHLDVEVPQVVQTEKKANTNDELLTKIGEMQLAMMERSGGENAALLQRLSELEGEVKQLRAKSA